MTLDDLLTTVAESTADEWAKADVPTPYTGICEDREVDEDELDQPSFHHSLAVYKPDIDISLAWGAIVVRPFWEPWVEPFRGDACSIAVWLRYRGAVVHEWVVASVDGGRCVLPIPGMREGKYLVLEKDLPMAELFFNLMSSVRDDDCLDNVMRRAGLLVAN